jgi:hypothetical protein
MELWRGIMGKVNLLEKSALWPVDEGATGRDIFSLHFAGGWL